MIISSKETAKFINQKDNNEEFQITNGYIGEIPKWVEDDWYFKALAADGSVTEIIAEPPKKVTATDPDKAAVEAKAKELKDAITKAKAEAKKEAEKEAEEKGLDVNAKKALITEKQTAAEMKVRAELEEQKAED